MKRSDLERLDDIADAIEAITAHAGNRDADERLKRDGILFNLMILGEAVKGLGEETRARRPEIPWRQIAGLRDLLAHEYYRVDMTLIEGILERDLGPLTAAVTALRAAKPRKTGAPRKSPRRTRT